jgi:hypothetical protein
MTQNMKRPVPVESASGFIDEKFRELGDCQGSCVEGPSCLLVALEVRGA